jgi:hypothetical protein
MYRRISVLRIADFELHPDTHRPPAMSTVHDNDNIEGLPRKNAHKKKQLNRQGRFTGIPIKNTFKFDTLRFDI